jgi:hypothetical protein
MDIFDRRYWVEVLARLVRRDYRPEPTLSDSSDGFLYAESHIINDQTAIKGPKYHQKDHQVALKKGISFTQMLFQFIDDKHIDEVKLYQHVMVSRSVFSKIRSNQTYQPDKDTVFKFAIGLRLNLEEGITFLASAGFNFKLSSHRDLVIRHCLETAKFDLLLVDELLYQFKEKPLFSLK